MSALQEKTATSQGRQSFYCLGGMSALFVTGASAAEDKAAVVMFLPLEYQYLSKRLQPSFPAKSKNPHFAVKAEAAGV